MRKIHERKLDKIKNYGQNASKLDTRIHNFIIVNVSIFLKECLVIDKFCQNLTEGEEKIVLA